MKTRIRCALKKSSPSAGSNGVIQSILCLGEGCRTWVSAKLYGARASAKVVILNAECWCNRDSLTKGSAAVVNGRDAIPISPLAGSRQSERCREQQYHLGSRKDWHAAALCGLMRAIILESAEASADSRRLFMKGSDVGRGRHSKRISLDALTCSQALSRHAYGRRAEAATSGSHALERSDVAYASEKGRFRKTM